MLIYIVLFVYLLVVGLTTKNKILFCLNVIFLILFIAFRGLEVGTDTMSYVEIYKNVGIYGYRGYPEPLYGYLNYILYNWGLSFSALQCFLSIVLFTLNIFAVRKYISNLNLFLFFFYSLFFVFYFMNISRQILAVSVVLLGYHYLYRKKYWGYLLCVFLATLLHYSALVSILILLIFKVNLNRKLFISTIILSLIIGFSFIDSFRALGVFGKYEHYLDSDVYGLRPHGDVMSHILLYRICWSILCFIIYSSIDRKYLNSLWMRIYVFSVVLDNLMMQISLGSRIVFYFSISQTIIYPLYLRYNNFKPHWIPYIAIIFVVLLFFGVFLLNNQADIIPYKTFF